MASKPLRIGIDLGGTKISGIALDEGGQERARRRVPTPRDDYDATLEAIASLVRALEHDCGTAGGSRVGIGMPGALSPRTGRVQNANSTWLNGRALDQDLAARLRRPLRFANDANCFALSEAVDGAGQGAQLVFGVILGTGCGGGLVWQKQLINGPLGIAGEWGHNPLPWASPDETPGPLCWCGRRGCMETWVSGPALARDFTRRTGQTATAKEVATLARNGNTAARKTLRAHASRLARGLAMVVNIFDPDIIVLGGGLSNLPHHYTDLPALMAPHLFTNSPHIRIAPPRHGDDSGVRGAAWLWA